MGGAEDVPALNKDLTGSTLVMEEEEKAVGDMKNSMFGWIDASVLDNQAGLYYAKGEVYIHPTSLVKDQISGYLSIFEQNGKVVILWTPKSAVEEKNEYVTIQPLPTENQGMRRSSEHLVQKETDKAKLILTKLIEGPTDIAFKYTIKVTVDDIHSIKRYIPSIGYSYIIINTKEGISLSPFYFHQGGIRDFFSVLSRFAILTRSNADSNILLVNDQTNRLSRTLSKLQLSTTDINEEEVIQAVKNVSYSFLENFAKVTQLARDVSSTIFEPKSQTHTSTHHHQNQKSDVKKMIDDFNPSLKKGNSTKQFLDRPQETDTTLGTFEILSTEKTLPVEEAVRRNHLNEERWKAHFSPEGVILDVDKLKREIYLGGIEPSIRPEVWKFLLGYYPFNSTEKERGKIREQKKEAYQLLKLQWTSIQPEQERFFSKFRERKHRIDKDVVRTDRALEVFLGDDSPLLKSLNDILITYTFYNFDLGYVQGMNDLLSPILLNIPIEDEAFWCFAGYMETMRHNFDKDQHGMHHQLLNLKTVLQVLDPELYHYFEKHDCLNLFFCFRWLLINFKREFPLEDVMVLWEVLWANPYSPHFHLFFCVAILQQQKRHIISKKMEFDDILKFVNELSMQIDLTRTLKEAEILIFKFSQTSNLEDLKAIE